MLEGGFRGEPKRRADALQAEPPLLNEKGPGCGPGPSLTRDPVSVLGSLSKARGFDGYDLRNWSNERDTWVLIGSVVSAAILVESALISFAWLANTSNCRRMKAD